jgi:hypothetical protein
MKMGINSDTPRTDAAVFKILSSLQSGTDDVVHADFARQLELELHQSRSEFLGAIQRRVIELGITPPPWPARNDIEAHDDVESAARMIYELCACAREAREFIEPYAEQRTT